MAVRKAGYIPRKKIIQHDEPVEEKKKQDEVIIDMNNNEYNPDEPFAPHQPGDI